MTLCRAPAVSGTRAPVAQLDRAPDYESGGRRFESFRARHFPFRAAGRCDRPFPWQFLCSAPVRRPGGPYPSLQPRAAEAIDPRVPVERPINDRPITPALAARLAELVSQARAGRGCVRAGRCGGRAARRQRRSPAKRGLDHRPGSPVGRDCRAGADRRALGDIDALGGQRTADSGRDRAQRPCRDPGRCRRGRSDRPAPVRPDQGAPGAPRDLAERSGPRRRPSAASIA